MNTERTIRHTANAGVLIKMGKNHIGIDLFSRDPQGLYPDTPEAVRRELFAQIQSGTINTLLFTHGHGDHFCLEDVTEAVRRNRKLRIISTRDVIRRLEETGVSTETMYAIEPDTEETVQMHVPGFSLTLFNSPHMGEAYRQVQNLVCMLEAEETRILIPGDAWPKPELFERIAHWSQTLHLLIGPFPLAGIPSNRKLLKKYLNIHQILALHLPRVSADMQGWRASAKKVCENANDGLPKAVFGEQIGTVYCMDSLTALSGQSN